MRFNVAVTAKADYIKIRILKGNFQPATEVHIGEKVGYYDFGWL